jgi:hypothetical protein
MPKYSVEIREIEVYLIEGIEADDEIDAKMKALEVIEDNNNKYKYHSDSDCEELVYDEE